MGAELSCAAGGGPGEGSASKHPAIRNEQVTMAEHPRRRDPPGGRGELSRGCAGTTFCPRRPASASAAS